MAFKDSNHSAAFVSAKDVFVDAENVIYGTAAPKLAGDDRAVAASKPDEAAILFFEETQRVINRDIDEFRIIGNELSVEEKLYGEEIRQLDKEILRKQNILNNWQEAETRDNYSSSIYSKESFEGPPTKGVFCESNKAFDQPTESDNAKKTVTAEQKQEILDSIWTSEQQKERKQEQLQRTKQRQKETKKAEGKSKKLSAASAALVATFESKRGIKNELGDMSSEVTGDLIADGSRGLIGGIIDLIKRAIHNAMAAFMGEIVLALGGFISSMIIPLVITVVAALLVNGSLAAVTGLLAADEGDDEYEIHYPHGNGHTQSSMSNAELDAIINDMYDLYNDPDNNIYNMGPTQEAILRWALSKVGCTYDQDMHWRDDVDIFDCSSLAYRSFLSQGIDISNNGLFSAAEECRSMVLSGRQISGDLYPGDLIFYGGADNDRYLGVYHVGIYVGDGKMVEARNERFGVVYCDVRHDNIVVCARAY